MRRSSDAYWEGAARGVLVLQRCGQCGKIRHYPRPLCSACHSFAVDAVESSGRGLVHSWTVTHHVFDPQDGADVPFALVAVDLSEGVRVLARMPDIAALRVGLPVCVRFADAPRATPTLILVEGREVVVTVQSRVNPESTSSA